MTRTHDLAVAGVAQAMRIDAWTATVFDALGAAGVDAVLLKGPVLAEWLYGGDRALRSYCDADVMVSVGDLVRSRGVLRDLGFDPWHRPTPRPLPKPSHAEVWFRQRDHAAVDLHHAMHSLERVDAARLWRMVRTNCEPFALCDTVVNAPNADLRALHLALHLRPGDAPGGRAWEDLRRGLGTIDLETWAGALRLADQLDVRGEVATVLAGFPGGGAVVDRLGGPRHLRIRTAAAHDVDAPTVLRAAATMRGVTAPMQWLTVLRMASPAAVRRRSAGSDGAEATGSGRGIYRRWLARTARDLVAVPGFVWRTRYARRLAGSEGRRRGSATRPEPALRDSAGSDGGDEGPCWRTCTTGSPPPAATVRGPHDQPLLRARA